VKIVTALLTNRRRKPTILAYLHETAHATATAMAWSG